MRNTTLTIMAALLLALPASASADYCMGATRTTQIERATADVAVVADRSVGPIAIGMTRREVSAAAGRPTRMRAGWRWRISGMPVTVQFGRYGRAYSIVADSRRLTVGGVALRAGADAVQPLLTGAVRGECLGQDVTLSVSNAARPRLTSVTFPVQERWLPRVTIVDGALRR